MGIAEIKNILSQSGVQASAARLAIADFVLHTDTHPTAEDVKDQVESRMPSVSLATVYNTLKLFVDKGLLAMVRDPNSDVVRYDCNTKPHFHFFDETTGKMIDLDPRLLKISPNFAELQEQFEIRGIEVTVKGRKKSD